MHIPVKDCPKTKSFGAVSSFGVVVFLMDSFEGSIPATCTELYDLDDAHVPATLRAIDCLGAPRRHNWRNILIEILDKVMCCQRRISIRDQFQFPSL